MEVKNFFQYLYRIISMSYTEQDVFYMLLALEEAKIAFKRGEVPVGSVLVKNNLIIGKSHNLKESSNDPTGHAEIIALREGAKKIGDWRLSEATLYVTKEPCVMCAGAMINARLGRLVYGCRDEKGGAVDSLYNILSDNRLNHRVEVISGVLKEECIELLKKFFQSKR